MFLFESYSDLNGDFSFLRKEPKYLPLFKKFLNDSENKITLSDLKVLYSQIQQHRNTFKQNNINILNDVKTVEDIDDMISKAIWIEKYNKFTKLLPKYLRTEIRGDKELSDKFKEYISEFDYNEYKNIFLTKVVKYKNTDELFDAIDKYLSGNIEKRQLIRDINDNPGIRVYSDIDGVLVSMVYSKKASCEFGSSQWCISDTRNNYWDSYVPDKKGVQYFIWDFNKKGVDPLSKIGVTIYDSGKFTAHNKSDTYISFDKIPFDKNDLKSFNNLSKDDKTMLILFNEELLKDVIEKEDSKGIDLRKLMKFNHTLYLKYYDNIDILSDDEVLEYCEKDSTLLIYDVFYDRLPKDQIFPILNKNGHKLSNLYDLYREIYKNSNYPNNININRIIKELSSDQKEELISKDIKLLGIDHFTKRMDINQLEKYVYDFPSLLFDNKIYDKLSTENIKKVILKFPEVYGRLSFSGTRSTDLINKPIDITEIEYRNMIHLLFERFNEGDYPENWANKIFSTNVIKESMKLWENFPKLNYLKDDNFTYSLFDDRKHVSMMLRFLGQYFSNIPLKKINNIYRKYENIIKGISDSDPHTPEYNIIKSYYSNPKNMKKFENEDLYIFNARYEKEKVGENPRNNKSIYEEVLSIERMLLYIPFEPNHIKMIKMRAMMQGDLETYGIWVTKGLLKSFSQDDGQTVSQTDLDGGMIDLIDERKFKI